MHESIKNSCLWCDVTNLTRKLHRWTSLYMTYVKIARCVYSSVTTREQSIKMSNQSLLKIRFSKNWKNNCLSNRVHLTPKLYTQNYTPRWGVTSIEEMAHREKKTFDFLGELFGRAGASNKIVNLIQNPSQPHGWVLVNFINVLTLGHDPNVETHVKDAIVRKTKKLSKWSRSVLAPWFFDRINGIIFVTMPIWYGQ